MCLLPSDKQLCYVIPDFADDGYPQKLDDTEEWVALMGAQSKLSTMSYVVSVGSGA